MNRSLAVLALMFAGMGAVKAQGFELENGKAEHTFYPDATAPVDCTIHFKNLKKSIPLVGWVCCLIRPQCTMNSSM